MVPLPFSLTLITSQYLDMGTKSQNECIYFALFHCFYRNVLVLSPAWYFSLCRWRWEGREQQVHEV